MESSHDMIALVSSTKKVVKTGGTCTRFSTVAGVEITSRIAKHRRFISTKRNEYERVYCMFDQTRSSGF